MLYVCTCGVFLLQLLFIVIRCVELASFLLQLSLSEIGGELTPRRT